MNSWAIPPTSRSLTPTTTAYSTRKRLTRARSTTWSPSTLCRGFVENHLGFDISQDLEAADWLTFPMQKLRSLVSGAVYHDAIGLEEDAPVLPTIPTMCGSTCWQRVGRASGKKST